MSGRSLAFRNYSLQKTQIEPMLNLPSAVFTEYIWLRPATVDNILNLCFTNNTDMVLNVKVTPTLILDHSTIELYRLKELLKISVN